MLSFQCVDVLNELKKLARNSDIGLSYLGQSTCICRLDDYDAVYDYAKYQDEIESIVQALVDEGYLRFTREPYSFCLTQKAIHRGQVSVSKVLHYVLDNWIAILALVVSIIALKQSMS